MLFYSNNKFSMFSFERPMKKVNYYTNKINYISNYLNLLYYEKDCY